MNYLIIIPRFANKPGDYYFFPLGIPYIAGSLKHAKKNFTTLNLNEVLGPVTNNIRDAVSKYNVDIVLTGGMSANYVAIKNIITAVKDIDARILTVVGGGIISSEPLVAMEGLGADIGVVGEGEATICELADALEQNKSLLEIPGLVIRQEGKLLMSVPRGPIDDLNSIPWPDYEGCGFFDYLNNITTNGTVGRELYMIASRSCPYDCTFCFHTTGKKYRQRTLDDFFEELDSILSKYRFDSLTICDELFSLHKQRTQELCHGMKNRVDKHGINWSVQVRADHVDKELLELLKLSGCTMISYGLESADNRILSSMKKHITFEQIENALKLTYEAEIKPHGIFIFGDMEETWETANNTLDWWKKHLEYGIHLANIMVYPGTHLYKYACEKGIIKDKIKYLEQGCPIINISKMNPDEFTEICNRITSYPQSFCYVPDKIEAHGTSGSGCRISVTCGFCGEKYDYTYYPFYYRYLRVPIPICSNCKQRSNLDDVFIERLLEPRLSELFLDDRKVAIWGCGDIANELFEKSKFIRDAANLIVVDKNPAKHGTIFWGHNIVSPATISEESILSTIITSIKYADEISIEIAENYPLVENIIKLNDMSTLFK